MVGARKKDTKIIAATDSGQKDMRIKKTVKALFDAMFFLLDRQNFNAITINALCSEALISRATFYAHFSDKYDLLEHLLADIKNTIVKDIGNYDELEREINQFVNLRGKIIANILKDANNETLGLVRGVFSSIVDLMITRNPSNESSSQHVILVNFLIGGLVNLLIWLVDNNFPPKVNMMNPYLYKMLEAMTAWDAKQDD